jgi:hypothetical protein
VLGYATSMHGDDDPFVIWSVAEWDDELRAIELLANRGQCKVFLFNEIAVNIAEASIILGPQPSLADVVRNVALYRRPDPRGPIPLELVRATLEQIYQGSATVGGYAEVVLPVPEWIEVRSMYIIEVGARAPLSLFASDEGEQQEQLGAWLIDYLQPIGSVRSPRVDLGSQIRELADLFLTYERGYFLIESKTLTILGRTALPSRERLKRDVKKGATKAVKQLRGAIRSIRRGLPVVNSEGVAVSFPSNALPHAIVLVPDLSLLNGVVEFGGSALRALAVEEMLCSISSTLKSFSGSCKREI